MTITLPPEPQYQQPLQQLFTGLGPLVDAKTRATHTVNDLAHQVDVTNKDIPESIISHMTAGIFTAVCALLIIVGFIVLRKTAFKKTAGTIIALSTCAAFSLPIYIGVNTFGIIKDRRAYMHDDIVRAKRTETEAGEKLSQFLKTNDEAIVETLKRFDTVSGDLNRDNTYLQQRLSQLKPGEQITVTGWVTQVKNVHPSDPKGDPNNPESHDNSHPLLLVDIAAPMGDVARMIGSISGHIVHSYAIPAVVTCNSVSGEVTSPPEHQLAKVTGIVIGTKPTTDYHGQAATHVTLRDCKPSDIEGDKSFGKI